MPVRQHAAHGLLGNAKSRYRGHVNRPRNSFCIYINECAANALAGVVDNYIRRAAQC
jgi:hypothetical protein